MIKKLSFLLLLFSGLTFLTAQIFIVDNVNYTVISGTDVEVSLSPYFVESNLVIPSTVTFNNKTYTVTAIGDLAFNTVETLQSVTIPNTVTKIGVRSFEECVFLTNVILPDSLITIGDNAFQFCTSLILFTIPNSVTSIGDYAFDNCTALTTFTIPNSVTWIGDGTFANCSNLISINIPNSVTWIGGGAFANCSNLTSINIPNSLTNIGNFAFTNCTSLTSITIPKSVSHIDSDAFSNCTNLSSIIINNPMPPVIDSSVFGGVNQNACSLTVPSSGVIAYKAADVWKNFNPITGSGTLAATNFKNQKNITIYPNPIQNETFLDLNNSANTKLEIYDTNGKLVLKKSLNNNSKNTIDTSNLPVGIYLFKVGNSTTKVIKK
ncbi:leucine-rich repeat domain-containing protein [Kaistella jeonii]|uniref:leucine-rich repeat domain-containing protein n=1 Tax=Kaistella jeonii TaxID=266749 RepID=UPI0006922BC5|nr:leucine-rich repeat domain-containing protein [Kaistella jeonii]SFC16278.1 Por secretion system C-terminal sorting domain-containing protein [Kaistella jeonii]VEI95372.1 Por secretion system C-terminal sorting domain [Kaistella jeonii]